MWPSVAVAWCWLCAVEFARLDGSTFLTLMTQVFFCKYNDPIYVKMEKLEIMIKLASDKNIDQVRQGRALQLKLTDTSLPACLSFR